MTTDPNPELADKTRAYLTAHGWTSTGDGIAGAMWTAPAGQRVAVPHWLAAILHLPWPAGMFALGDKMPGFSHSYTVAVVLFVLLAISLFVSARKKLSN